MKNEPVAWWDGNPKNAIGISKTKDCNDWFPLYTHPVKELGNPVAWRSQDPDGYWSVYQAPVEGAEPLYTGFKQLTDEFRIKELESEIERLQDQLNEFLVARDLAILRKAQEK